MLIRGVVIELLMVWLMSLKHFEKSWSLRYSSLFFIVADDCCYYYLFSPGNLNCNPQGQPSAVVLGCSIYSPNGSDVTVRWYRSTQEHLARVQGELVTNGHNCIDNTRNLIPFRGLDLSRHYKDH